MDTKAVLKFLKINESAISMILGAVVIVILGIIMVNYFRNQSRTLPSSTSSQNTESEEAVTATGINQEHVVTKGETLWAISQKNYQSGYNWVDIAKANDIAAPYTISEGQKLAIPTLTESSMAKISEDDDKENYTVQKGDSLWKIAQNVYGSGEMWVKIAQANNLSDPQLIHSGNTLKIP